MKKSIKERILENVTICENSCWNWNLSLRKGYGRISINGKRYSAHRISFEQFNSKIEEGFEIDHLCKNKSCVNPKHLESVTRSENIKRSKPDNCPKGHEYNEENTYLNPSRGGFRQCKKCESQRKKKSYKNLINNK